MAFSSQTPAEYNHHFIRMASMTLILPNKFDAALLSSVVVISGVRQHGHISFDLSHKKMQSLWKQWLQCLESMITSPSSEREASMD